MQITPQERRNVNDFTLNSVPSLCQYINFGKSKMLVSNNIPRRKARRFSTLSGIPLTSDLGKYLTIPLLHSRATKYHFNKVIEKVQRRLTTWKSNNLNLTGRATYIQSVTSTIPS